MEATAKQDMPPPGGYRPVNFSRIPAKVLFRGLTMFGGFIALNGLTLAYYFGYARPAVTRLKVENRSGQLAVYPLLLAERDREFLKQLRRNRDEEAKLMANVPGWEVGKWNGENVYKTLKDDSYVSPDAMEYYVHAPYWDYYKRAHDTLML